MRTEFWWVKTLKKLSLGRPIRRYVDDIKMHLREIRREDGRWMQLAQDHVQLWVMVLVVLNLQSMLSVLLYYLQKVNGHVRGCIQKFPDWPPGARTANGTALCH
jgi:hypothetical protein